MESFQWNIDRTRSGILSEAPGTQKVRDVQGVGLGGGRVGQLCVDDVGQVEEWRTRW